MHLEKISFHFVLLLSFLFFYFTLPFESIDFPFSCHFNHWNSPHPLFSENDHGRFSFGFLFVPIITLIPQWKVKHDLVLLLCKGLRLDSKTTSPHDPGLK